MSLNSQEQPDQDIVRKFEILGDSIDGGLQLKVSPFANTDAVGSYKFTVRFHSETYTNIDVTLDYQFEVLNKTEIPSSKEIVQQEKQETVDATTNTTDNEEESVEEEKEEKTAEE